MCPFCEIVSARTWVIEGALVVAIDDAFPISPGHMLVIPRRHEPDFFALTDEELVDTLKMARTARERLVERHHPNGFNVGVNIGAAAGQTVGHAHLHVIPRYEGDVEEPRGGIRWILPSLAPYWEKMR